MEFGRNGHLGVCAHSHVVEAKELGRGHVYLLSMGEDHVMDLKHSTSLAILPCALVSMHRMTVFAYEVCFFLFPSLSLLPLWPAFVIFYTLSLKTARRIHYWSKLEN